MSIPVDLEQLRSVVTERGPAAFLLTVTDDARPHVVAVAVGWDGDALVMSGGRTTAANAAERPAVTMLWPGAPGDYSLIVDGAATVEAGDAGGRITVRPTRAVLHRPAVGEPPAATRPGCTADCVPLDGA